MYELVVGEGGVDPEYFMKRMAWWEVQRYVNGIRRRERSGWVQTRWLGWLVSKVLGSKIDEPEELMQFPWEQERIDPKQQEEDLKRLLDQCRAENKAAELGKP